ncbi:MAG: pyridoxamine 5'-phosphate oxidase family protein [Campylobacteraceae bacterium]
MRRVDFNITQKEVFEGFLCEQTFGSFAINDTKYPYIFVVNFAYNAGSLFFHGAKEGRKYELINQNAFASFNAYKPYSYIPSYFGNTKFACGATQFFASVFCEGELKELNDDIKKAKALNLLMQKHQDKNSFLDIEENLSMYKTMMDKTAVFEFKIENWSMKIKVGQQLNEEKRENLINHLEDENSDISKETIKTIKTYM